MKIINCKMYFTRVWGKLPPDPNHLVKEQPPTMETAVGRGLHHC